MDAPNDVVQYALIVGHDNVLRLSSRNALTLFRHNFQRIDIQPGVGLIKACTKFRPARHLQNIIALFPRAGKPTFHRTGRSLRHFQQCYLTDPENQSDPTTPARGRRAHGIQCGCRKTGYDAGDLPGTEAIKNLRPPVLPATVQADLYL